MAAAALGSSFSGLAGQKYCTQAEEIKSMQEGIKLSKRQVNKLCKQKEIKIMQEDGIKGKRKK